MATYGYARVSTIDQDLSLQRRTLKAACCDVIRAEKASGTRRSGRSELQDLLDFLRLDGCDKERKRRQACRATAD